MAHRHRAMQMGAISRFGQGVYGTIKDVAQQFWNNLITSQIWKKKYEKRWNRFDSNKI